MPIPASRRRSCTIWLRLKLIADAGLVGLPNAGKSTFLAAVSAAKPKIADYPFTTLHPNLGVVRVDSTDFVLADIPGLIEGAHEGAGIGDRFLGHVERTAVLLHLVDATLDDPVEAYEIIRGELEAYGAGLEEKPEILALSKSDAVPADELKKKARGLKKVSGVDAVDPVRRERTRHAGGTARVWRSAWQHHAARRRRLRTRKRQAGGHETRVERGETPRGQDRLIPPRGRRDRQPQGGLAALRSRTILRRFASEGREVIVVSSGAIALGRNALKLPKGALKLEDSQAAAAVGQIGLAHAYEDVFRARGLVAAQILVTLGDTEERKRYLNARSTTIARLPALGAVPVVNENDTVATSEIRYGDNDRLAARVASMISADCLVLLSDVDGLLHGPARIGRRRAPPRRGRGDHARDRGDGGRCRLRAFARRHGDEDRGGEDRGRGGHPYGDREWAR